MLCVCAVCPLQETILPLPDEGEGYSAGDLLHPEEERHKKSNVIPAQHTIPCCVSLHFLTKGHFCNSTYMKKSLCHVCIRDDRHSSSVCC